MARLPGAAQYQPHSLFVHGDLQRESGRPGHHRGRDAAEQFRAWILQLPEHAAFDE